MWQEKQTKEIINKETCKRDILLEYKISIPLYLIIGVLSVLISLISIPMGDHFIMSLKQISEWDLISVGYIAMMSFAELFLVSFGVIGIGAVVYIFVSMYRIKGGHFDIVEDVLVSIVEDEPVRKFGDKHTRYYDVFYFARTGRYVVTAADKSAWDYSSEDDKFYVVLMGKRKKTPMKVYNAKVYEYREG